VGCAALVKKKKPNEPSYLLKYLTLVMVVINYLTMLVVIVVIVKLTVIFFTF